MIFMKSKKIVRYSKIYKYPLPCLSKKKKIFFWVLSAGLVWKFYCVQRLRFGLGTHATVNAVNTSFFLLFIFFFTRFRVMRLLFMHGCMNSNRKCWLFYDEQWFVHCLRIHKFYFSVTFSLKIGPTTLFTYLKNILLQCF